ncbi:MAG: PrsW family intramembrane metalloprotease [Bacteroidales bacterium]|nr:PrsW family intramembrane metalloprotease [Bacteroidales bacterium]
MWIILAAAIVPGILLLYYVYSKDFNPEPKRMIYKGFFYGCLSVLASTLISGPLLKLGFFVDHPSTLAEAIKTSFFGAAIPEESAKLLMLWLLLRNSPEFDERYDGMVYAASVGLGFACLENLMYVVSAGAGWFYVSVTRALFAVPGHFAFAIAMGYYFSRNHFDSHKTTEFDRIKVWLVPVLLHGIYDTLAFSSEISPAYSGLITIALIFFCIRIFKSTRQRIQEEAARNTYEATHNIDDQYDK